MTRVLHMSDPHFGTEQAPVVQALLKLIHISAPDVLLLGGDVTQRARRGQFSAAADFLRQAACPVLCIPGNHDIPLFNIVARLFYPYANYQRAMGRDLEPVFESETVLAIGVNSTRWRRHRDGEVSDEQIERVSQRLQRATARQMRIVMVHHPVRAKVESDHENLLHGRQRAVPAWVDAGADFILGGHIHLPYWMPLAGSGPASRRGWMVQAGTALSHRVRGHVPNSVNIINRHTAGLCVVERWDYDAQTQAFALVDQLDAKLARAADSPS